jgi:galactose oxidase
MRLDGRLRAILTAAALTGCQNDSARPNSPEGSLASIGATYLCGNDFQLANRAPAALTVHYQVLESPEDGELILPPASASSESLTRLTTLHAGDLRISVDSRELPSVPNSGAGCPSPTTWSEPGATTGEWSEPFTWPVVAVHLHLLPSKQVLSWGRTGDPHLWDPESGNFTPVPTSTMVFCSGHTFLADGRLLVSGGHISDEHGLPDVNVFDGATGTWAPLPPMHWGRWYPTSTTLADGQVVTMGGKDQDGVPVDTPEVWTGDSWRRLAGAARALPYYPRTFVAPNGLLFYAGELPETAYLDVNGGGTWLPVATSQYGRRDYGTAVMYRPGQVMIVGGSDPPDGAPTPTAEVIDLNQPSPSWRYTAPMNYARRHLNATLLPDGTVLVTGGTASAGFSDPAGAVHAAELWDPATGLWSLLASNQVDRVYHSTTLLLPDGRLLHTGSGDGPGLPRELNAELFSPPYLFKGPRPVVSSVPEAVEYGEQFPVLTPDAGAVVQVTLVRLSSVTHAFDQSQRFLELSFRRSAGGVTILAPSSGALAPPGPYMIFLVNEAGVPSLASILRLQ